MAGAEFAAHESVNHSREKYARGDVTTNTVEGFFGIFKCPSGKKLICWNRL